MRPSIGLLLALLAVLAVAAGCGESSDSAVDFTGAERAVAQTVEDLQDASVDEDEGRICRELLAPDLARRAGTCERTVAQALDEADSKELRVEDVTVRGTTAEVQVTSGRDDDARERLRLVRVGRAWRFASLGGAQ